MKGKNVFTVEEIEALKKLISLRVKVDDKATQKKIRDVMRRIGFYGGDDFGVYDCQIYDLERLIRNGEITVIGGEKPTSLMAKETPNHNIQKASQTPKPAVIDPVDSKDAEQKLIKGQFVAVNTMNDSTVPDVPGLYCIKLRKGIPLPKKFGTVREDGIIYIGQASKSLYQRFWRQELNHRSAATFFRSIGAILGFLPPKGSLYGKETRNYKFSPEDTEAIKKWMRQSLLVNWIPFSTEKMDAVEESLIRKYCPLVNIDHNPSASNALKEARKSCVEYAKSR